MNCGHWEERVALHAGGDLKGSEAAETERHLEQCAECRLFEEQLRASLDLLHEAHGEQIGEAPFAAVRARVLGRLEGRRALWRWAWAGGAALAGIAVLAFTLWPKSVAPPAVAVARPPALWDRPPGLSTRQMTATTKDRSPRVRLARRPVPQTPGAGHGPAPQNREPLVVKLLTDDPDIVIYWITEGEN